jgi:hypothetical protein
MSSLLWRLGSLCCLGCLFFPIPLERIHSWYSFCLVHVLSPAPLGWKLEPRLYGAVQKAISFYSGSFHAFVWRPFAGLHIGSHVVVCAGAAWSLLLGNERGLLAATAFLLFIAGGGLVLMLAFTSKRICVRVNELLFSLALLFSGRFYSTLRNRSESLCVSLDNILLALLLFTAIVLLYPVILFQTLLLYVVNLPLNVCIRLLARRPNPQ